MADDILANLPIRWELGRSPIELLIIEDPDTLTEVDVWKSLALHAITMLHDQRLEIRRQRELREIDRAYRAMR